LSRILASVGIFVEQEKKQQVLAGLSRVDNLEELYDVAGEYDILSLVSASGLDELHETLQNRILKIQGIKCVITNIILKPYKAKHSKFSGAAVSVAAARRF
jgi:DNA-binding Lrp family transcriptional regulator